MVGDIWRGFPFENGTFLAHFYGCSGGSFIESWRQASDVSWMIHFDGF